MSAERFFPFGRRRGGRRRGRHCKPKLHYAVQLAFYVDILERLGLSAGRGAFVWDINGEEVPDF
jgi:hypothetical protein